MPPPTGAREGGGSGGAGGVDPAGQGLAVGRVEQALHGDVDEGGIGQVGVAIGEGALRGLDPEVGPAQVGAGGRAAVARDEGPEQSGGSSARRMLRTSRATRPELFGGWVVADRAAVLERERRLPGGGVGGQVRGRDPAAGRRKPRRLAGGELARVEVVGTGRRQPLQRRREGREPDALARAPRTPVRTVGRGPAAGAVAQLAGEDRGGTFDCAREVGRRPGSRRRRARSPGPGGRPTGAARSGHGRRPRSGPRPGP